MSLTNKQKKWIEKNKGKLSVEKLSKELNISKDVIENYLKPKPQTTPNKFFYLTLVLIPVLFFILLEAGLRIFNYGYDFTQWVNVTKGMLVLNPDLAHKYFQNTKNVPISNQDVFDEVKTDSTFRVFVLGESSGAGYPFVPIGSFSRYIQERLRLLYPHSKIEVVNCSMTAINTYTLRDMMPGIVEQKPDLILIYTGHNEYYGALGVGSMESLGTSRTIVNLMISLEKYKTFQLLKNTLRWAAGLLSKPKELTGTLMSRMAENQYIGLDSDIYEKGLDQFEGNMKDILEIAKDKNIPVILGTLASNLKDQHPFVSINYKNFPPSDRIYNQAKEELAKRDFQKADSLFRYAKDLDALRFRAPSEMNKIIFDLGREFNYPVINIDSVFDAISPDGIVGDNLMTDHLHPTLRGYKIIGKLFYEEMEKENDLPGTKPLLMSNDEQDSLTRANFKFSILDSVIAEYRIKLLKNDWPYIDKSQKKPLNELIKPKDYIDSLAYKLMNDGANWETVHRRAAEYYIKINDYKNFLEIMDVLISEYPFIVEYYDYTANQLLDAKIYDKAYHYLKKRYYIEPNDFSAKWLGIINLNDNKIDLAKKFLLESLKFNNKDAQTWYNLAGCYVIQNDYKSALDAVNKSLKISPQYQAAVALQVQLLKTEQK